MTTDKEKEHPPKKIDSKQLQEISVASLLEEGGLSRQLKNALYIIATILLVLFIWSALAKVDEVALSYGDIQPVQKIVSVQHLEGGIVAAVYVKNGDEVKAGEKLLKFNPEQVAAELQKAQSRELAMTLDATRLKAFIDETPPLLVKWRDAISKLSFNTISNHEKTEGLLKEAIDLLNKQNLERDNQRAVYREKIEERTSELKQYTDSEMQLQKKLLLDKQEEDMYGSLVKEGYVSRKEFLTAQRKTLDDTSLIKEMEAKIAQSQNALEESQGELQRLNSSFNKEASKELNQLTGELLEVHYTIERLTALSERLVMEAPESGIIKGLTVAPGSVIAPGDIIMDIVPTQGSMQVECKVSPHDIGHVHVGDFARVKVMAYEFTRYGTVDGKVSEISASTFLSKDELPYYKTKVMLEKNYVGNDPRLNPLKPGMTVQVDIITGEKSVLSYLITPITRGLKDAFRER